MNTFDVNPNMYAISAKLIKLSMDATTDTMKENLGQACINFVENKKVYKNTNLNLQGFSKSYEKHKATAKESRELPILNEVEYQQGHVGITDIKNKSDFTEAVDDEASIPYMVAQFVDMQDLVQREINSDIWRLLELSVMEDKKAQRFLRAAVEPYVGLREIIEFVIKTPRAYFDLDKIFNPEDYLNCENERVDSRIA